MSLFSVENQADPRKTAAPGHFDGYVTRIDAGSKRLDLVQKDQEALALDYSGTTFDPTGFEKALEGGAQVHAIGEGESVDDVLKATTITAVVLERTVTLQESRDVAVMDKFSRWTLVPIAKGLFGKKSLSVAFDKAGYLSKISRLSEAELAGLAQALEKLPADYYDALKQANETVDEQQELALQRLDHRIEELKKERELITQEVVTGGALASAQQTAEIERLGREITQLEKEASLVQLQQAAEGAAELAILDLQTKITSAQTALEQAETQRLKVQADLEKLRRDGEGAEE